MTADTGEDFNERMRRARRDASPHFNEEPFGINIAESQAESLLAYLKRLKVKGLHHIADYPCLIVVSENHTAEEINGWIDDWLAGKDLKSDQPGTSAASE